MWRRPRAPERGFTLVELMTVVMIIMILAGIALPRFKVAVIRAREAALREDLYRLRQAIGQYHADKGQYPADLPTLKTDGYVREVEVDPITGTDFVGVPCSEVYPDATAEESEGTCDVHSASELPSLEGTLYSEW